MTASSDSLNDKKQVGRDYLWNSLSSLMSSFSLVIMLMVVTRSAGIVAAGIYSLAIAVGQQFQTLGMYEVRTYHVTDVQRRYSFGTYLATRIVTTILMVMGIIIHALRSSGNAPTILLIIAIASLRVFDAVEDVFYSEFQRVGRLDIGGRASFLRITATMLIFCGGLIITKSLLHATLLTLVCSTIVLIIVFIPPARRMYSLKPQWEWRGIAALLWECLPLFLASFLAMYLANAPRYAVDSYMDKAAQGYFAIIYMPAVAINMLSLLVFRPLLTRMAARWVIGDRHGFMSVIRKGLFTSLAASVLVAIVSWFLGVWILNLVFHADVSMFRLELMVLVAAGALNAFSVILYYALTTMRRQTYVFFCYGAAATAVWLLAHNVVAPHGLLGAAYTYGGGMTVLCLGFIAGLIYRGPVPRVVSRGERKGADE
ncbi:lipopolysaccharide biosynthesis protein [Actinomyces vulturis]|uniref:lipopolysaccharide biosynthesis protein n=1 Tax=Actinomyces vulturis TaxID=1857645 RepID=UPI00083071A2|nr:polysaccharide biosynthesis protein [Actinomyces vulturis]